MVALPRHHNPDHHRHHRHHRPPSTAHRPPPPPPTAHRPPPTARCAVTLHAGLPVVSEAYRSRTRRISAGCGRRGPVYGCRSRGVVARIRPGEICEPLLRKAAKSVMTWGSSAAECDCIVHMYDAVSGSGCNVSGVQT